jgi:predicted nucleic acid-binding protein
VSFLPANKRQRRIASRAFDFSIRRLRASASAQRSRKPRNLATAAGRERICTNVAALVDTNILVYRFDSRFPEKQKIAAEILRRGIVEDDVRLPHQAIVEFVAAATRLIRGHVILKQADALREAEEFLKQFPVLYPNEAILREAVRGCAAYQLSWFDAHIWSYAEHYGLPTILTEDLQHDRLYGSVRVVNPFRK